MIDYKPGDKVEYYDTGGFVPAWIPATVTKVQECIDEHGWYTLVFIKTWHLKELRLIGPMIRMQLRHVTP